MQALFNDYLMHFCGKNKTPRQAQGVLESILKRRQFIASRCPLFNDPEGRLEKEQLQAWASMVCFTDLRFQDLEPHVAKFGPYGIALKKDSAPARRCSPVHYVQVGSETQENSRMLSEGIRHLLQLQKEGTLDKDWEFPRQLKEFDDRRVASLQDIRTRIENEWRFIGTEKERVLEFEPEDIRFLLVETWAQAVRWNRRLNDPGEEDLYPYGKAGVMAVAVEMLLGAKDEAQETNDS
jgi:hypothetical protein